MPVGQRRASRRSRPGSLPEGLMADVLSTVLQLVGGQQYVSQLNQAAAAHRQLARAQQQQAGAQRQVQAAMAAGRAPSARQQQLAGGAGLPLAVGGFAAGAAIAAVGAIAIAIKEATNSFIAYDRAVIGAQITLKNMGGNLPVGELRSFSRQLSLTTGTSETDL